MAEQQLNLEEIFFVARQKPPQARAAYLDQVCGADVDLARVIFGEARSQVGIWIGSSREHEAGMRLDRRHHGSPCHTQSDHANADQGLCCTRLSHRDVFGGVITARP